MHISHGTVEVLDGNLVHHSTGTCTHRAHLVFEGDVWPVGIARQRQMYVKNSRTFIAIGVNRARQKEPSFQSSEQTTVHFLLVREASGG